MVLIAHIHWISIAKCYKHYEIYIIIAFHGERTKDREKELYSKGWRETNKRLVIWNQTKMKATCCFRGRGVVFFGCSLVYMCFLFVFWKCTKLSNYKQILNWERIYTSTYVFMKRPLRAYQLLLFYSIGFPFLFLIVRNKILRYSTRMRMIFTTPYKRYIYRIAFYIMKGSISVV